MILATQPFFNELDLLEIKLNTMAPYVDKFLICEATHTYTGLPKPLHFQENKDRFKDFPIHHVVVQSLQGEMNPWIREGHQRDTMHAAAVALNPEIIIWNDLDEMVRQEAVEEFKKSRHPIMALEKDWLRYYFNRVQPEKWKQRVISRDKRHHTGCSLEDPVIRDAGWHFNFCTNHELFLKKLKATSHAVDDQHPWYYNEVVNGRRPQLDRTSLYDESRLPVYLQQNRERFKDIFWKEGDSLQ